MCGMMCVVLSLLDMQLQSKKASPGKNSDLNWCNQSSSMSWTGMAPTNQNVEVDACLENGEESSSSISVSGECENWKIRAKV